MSILFECKCGVRERVLASYIQFFEVGDFCTLREIKKAEILPHVRNGRYLSVLRSLFPLWG